MTTVGEAVRCLTDDEIQALIEAQGRIEAGMIANMRTYLLPLDARVHVRIVGTDHTLCGRSLRNHGEWAWQFCSSGSLPQGTLPSYTGRHDRACKSCSRHPIVQATMEIAAARKKAMERVMRRPRRRVA